MPYKVASVEGVMHGLYLLWWTHERQLPVVMVSAALAAGDLAKIAFEFPTGWFADRVGHRLSLIVGSVIQVAGLACCWLATGVGSLSLAALLVALGDAFRSGADHALIYRTCVAIEREADFQKIEGRAKTFQLLGLVALVLTGGIIVRLLGYTAGWMTEISLSAIGVVLAALMREPPPARDVEHVQFTRPSSNRGTAMRAIVMLIAPSMLTVALGSGTSFFAQTGTVQDPETMTLLVALMTSLEAAGAMVASRLAATGTRMQWLLAACGTALFAASILGQAIFIAVVLALSFVQGLAETLRAAAIQRASTDEMRARAASIASACDMAARTIALPAAGFIRALPRSTS